VLGKPPFSTSSPLSPIDTPESLTSDTALLLRNRRHSVWLPALRLRVSMHHRQSRADGRRDAVRAGQLRRFRPAE
jgi:hypothetical protein